MNDEINEQFELIDDMIDSIIADLDNNRISLARVKCKKVSADLQVLKCEIEINTK